MKQNESQNASDPEALLRAEGGRLNASLLRRFACECCRRVSHLCGDPIYLRLLEFAESRVSGSASHDQLTTLRSDATRLYDRLYPGYGSPSATVLALSAVGEAAFTESPLNAAINASTTAAMAAASAAAVAADDEKYDAVHDATYLTERQAQSELLRQLNSTHDGSEGG